MGIGFEHEYSLYKSPFPSLCLLLSPFLCLSIDFLLYPRPLRPVIKNSITRLTQSYCKVGNGDLAVGSRYHLGQSRIGNFHCRNSNNFSTSHRRAKSLHFQYLIIPHIIISTILNHLIFYFLLLQPTLFRHLHFRPSIVLSFDISANIKNIPPTITNFTPQLSKLPTFSKIYPIC